MKNLRWPKSSATSVPTSRSTTSITHQGYRVQGRPPVQALREALGVTL